MLCKCNIKYIFSIHVYMFSIQVFFCVVHGLNLEYAYDHNVSFCDPNSLPLPKMATTTSPFKISMEPREMKYSAGITSPAWTKVSPGGACVVLNFIAKARKQPLVEPLKALQFCSNVRFRCKQMSACKHSGNPFSTCNEIKEANVINDTAQYAMSRVYARIKRVGKK